MMASNGAKGRAYEVVVARVAKDLLRLDEESSGVTVATGSDARILGSSEVVHQIDIAISRSSELHIIECKHWGKKVGQAAMMILDWRMRDIANAKGGDIIVTASLVTTQECSKGARLIAAYTGVQLDVVSDEQEYVIRLRDRLFAGTRDVIEVRDDVRHVLIKGNREPEEQP
jgi:hypothetical protein